MTFRGEEFFPKNSMLKNRNTADGDIGGSRIDGNVYNFGDVGPPNLGIWKTHSARRTFGILGKIGGRSAANSVSKCEFGLRNRNSKCRVKRISALD
jgi:hypothetical protein